MSKTLQVIIILGVVLSTAFLVFSFQQREKSKADYVEFQQLEKLKEQGQVEEISFEEWKKNNPNASEKYLEWRKQQFEKPQEPTPQEPTPQEPTPQEK